MGLDAQNVFNLSQANQKVKQKKKRQHEEHSKSPLEFHTIEIAPPGKHPLHQKQRAEKHK